MQTDCLRNYCSEWKSIRKLFCFPHSNDQIIVSLSQNDAGKHQYGINELKFKILNDRRTFGKDEQDFNLPPYLKKRNRRFKSIYESMHENGFGRKSKRRNGEAFESKPPQYGHLEYQQFLHRNEIPDVDLLNKLLRKSLNSVDGDHHHHHHKNHHHYQRSHQKKLRSRPEAGIMQKKLKIN